MKHILITGCGSGLGKILWEKGKSLNCKIYPHFRVACPDDLNSSDALVGDITDPRLRSQFSSFLKNREIHVFVNNAAIYEYGPLADVADVKIIELININLISQILLIKSAYRYFREKGRGLIINVNSLAGLYPSENESVYCASKFGLRGFSKSLQMEALHSGVEIIDLYPGAMNTKLAYKKARSGNIIQTEDVSEMIFNLILNTSSFYCPEIVIRKRVVL